MIDTLCPDCGHPLSEHGPDGCTHADTVKHFRGTGFAHPFVVTGKKYCQCKVIDVNEFGVFFIESGENQKVD